MSESHSVYLDLKTKYRGTLGIAEHGRVYEGSQVAIFWGKDGTELHGTCTGAARELHESLTESNGQRQSGRIDTIVAMEMSALKIMIYLYKLGQ